MPAGLQEAWSPAGNPSSCEPGERVGPHLGRSLGLSPSAAMAKRLELLHGYWAAPVLLTF